MLISIITFTDCKKERTILLVSIAVTPANPNIAKGLTQQFTATGTFIF